MMWHSSGTHSHNSARTFPSRLFSSISGLMRVLTACRHFDVTRTEKAVLPVFYRVSQTKETFNLIRFAAQRSPKWPAVVPMMSQIPRPDPTRHRSFGTLWHTFVPLFLIIRLFWRTSGRVIR